MVGPVLPAETMHDTGQLLYTSLLLLGLDAAALEHSLRTPINQKMFVRMNKKLGENILHFLFVTIDRERGAKVFRDCWPMVDRKQEALFHKATFEWYKSLQQTYGQMVPSVVAKTFMVPGGPKFTSTLTSLIRVALHCSITKKAPQCMLLSFPAFSRNASQNHETLQVLRSFKHAHYRNYITRQAHRQRLIKSFQIKVREAVSRYRNACAEGEKAVQQVQELIHTNTSLTQHQRDNIPTMTVPEIEKEIHDNIALMNATAERLWKRMEKFHEVEDASWKIIAPLLDGSTLSYIDGAKYFPRIPDIIYKEHASTINKLGVEGGVYEGDQLNLLSLVHYSNLALTSLLTTFTAKHSSSPPDPTVEMDVQGGQVSSLKETVIQLSAHLATLLPTLRQSVASARLSTTSNPVCSTSTNTALDSLELDGKPHLCPPTPPFSLMSTPVVSGKGAGRNHHLTVQLTPGMVRPKLGPKVNLNSSFDPKLPSTKDHSSHVSLHRAKYPAVLTQDTSEKDSLYDKPVEEEEESEGLSAETLSADCRGRYLQQKERELELLQSSRNHFLQTSSIHKRKPKTRIPLKIPSNKRREELSTDYVSAVEVKKKDMMVSMEGSLEVTCERIKATNTDDSDFNYALLEELTSIVANEDDDSGTAEHLTTQIWQKGSQSTSTHDSGCLEMTLEDTLLETVEMMNITPGRHSTSQKNQAKSLRTTSRQSLTPLPSPGMLSLEKTVRRNSFTHPHLARLIDATPCGPIKYDEDLPQNRISTDQVNLSPAERQNSESPLDKEEQRSEKYLDFLPRMVFLTQEPVKSASPMASKVQSIYNELGFNTDSNSTGPKFSEYHGNGFVNEDSFNPRAKVNILFEQLKQLKLQQQPPVIKNGKESGSKNKFLSYVETKKNIKQSEKTLDVIRNECGNTEIQESWKMSLMSGDENTGLSVEDHVNGDCIDKYFKSIAKGQIFLEESEGDSTLLDSTVKEDAEEKFACDPDEVCELLNAPEPYRSVLLPNDSVFDTLADSILYGESSQALLQQDQVISEIRRESIASRRQSLASSGRLSFGSSKCPSERLSTFYSCLAQDYSGILDESDSCLLSTSMEDF